MNILGKICILVAAICVASTSYAVRGPRLHHLHQQGYSLQEHAIIDGYMHTWTEQTQIPTFTPHWCSQPKILRVTYCQNQVKRRFPIHHHHVAEQNNLRLRDGQRVFLIAEKRLDERGRLVNYIDIVVNGNRLPYFSQVVRSCINRK